LLPGIQVPPPFRRPLEGLLPLRDDEAENLWSGIAELLEMPTGSSAQAKIKNEKSYVSVFNLNCPAFSLAVE